MTVNQDSNMCSKTADYRGLASLMGNYGDTAIFRRFRMLNLQSLLHMQAEIVHLEQELQEIYQEDKESTDPVRQSYQSNWKAMEDSSRTGGDSLQRSKLLEVREKLEKYYASLLTQAQLNALPRPEERNIGVLREWLQRPAYGNMFLRGFEKRTWDVEQVDFVALQKQADDSDPLTRWLFRVIPGFFHNRWAHRWKSPVHGREGEEDLFDYKSSTIVRFATSATTLLSTAFPLVSIPILYFVENMLKRLGLIVVFTSLFSLALLFTSNARRVEIFMASSAFAAVQVVFVGSTDTPCSA
ncbi:hypothetical protein F5B22DRAFT_109055 [Xylaria bambusicola]|uniref:uncharacterized protein n=1 Tax=Xylaria bambusicola TaxID=326684 RepID=UPI002007BBC3|nr:uncharacterized protein F5B22DRAFT_109055 [Xylaria bambusicola]KAI0517530.1 hypothetical protein F5B22DRAFT_109055 [Xylaria bambusicola]